jgi:hypothetical protein
MDELESFKTDINLSEYAASLGYRLDRSQSSRNSVVMRHESGDKVIIARGLDNHWIYFSVRDDRDNGSIIDFIQRRKGLSFGHIRKELREWTGRGRITERPELQSWARSVEPASKNLMKVIAAIGRMQAVKRHSYLESRGIPASALQDSRLEGRILTDNRRNAVFPHWNRSGICGYELKNRNFTGFSPGGEKGLWITRAAGDYRRLVIAESAIDALSYAAIFPDADAIYASTGGKMNPGQPGLIRAAISRLTGEKPTLSHETGGRPTTARETGENPAFSHAPEVIAATDADADGRKLAERIEAIAEEAGVLFRSHEPPEEGSDWNDYLRAATQRVAKFTPE